MNFELAVWLKFREKMNNMEKKKLSVQILALLLQSFHITTHFLHFWHCEIISFLHKSKREKLSEADVISLLDSNFWTFM